MPLSVSNFNSGNKSVRVGPWPTTCFCVFYSRVTVTSGFLSWEGHVLMSCHLIGSWVTMSPHPLGPSLLGACHIGTSMT